MTPAHKSKAGLGLEPSLSASSLKCLKHAHANKKPKKGLVRDPMGGRRLGDSYKDTSHSGVLSVNIRLLINRVRVPIHPML